MHEKNFTRFIAGAVCPSCHLLDKIVYEKHSTYQAIHCVSCNYQETKLNAVNLDSTSSTFENME